MSDDARTQMVAEALAEIDVKDWAAVFKEAAELSPEDEYRPNLVDEYSVEAAELVRRIGIASKGGVVPDVGSLGEMMVDVFEESYGQEFSADEFEVAAEKIRACFE